MHIIHAGRQAIRLHGFGTGRVSLAGALALAIGVAGCGSSTGVDTLSNPDEPSEAELNDFLDQDIREASAFDILSSSPVRLDSNSRWDFLFQILGDGTAQLKPRGAVTESESDAGLRKLSTTFDETRSAPINGYQLFRAMAVAEGDVIAARSQRDAGLSIRCRRYAKIEILSIDRAAGTMMFRHLVNPNCENRNLVPGAAVPIDEQ